MDGFRGAFARYDFQNNFVKYASYYNDGGGENNMRQSPAGVARKMNINSSTFSSGFSTTDDTWINNARSPANNVLFGWRGVIDSGSGVKQMARTIANSRAFSSCMVKKVYREVCRRKVSSYESEMIKSMTTSFENKGYNLKSLFEEIAIRPECLGAR